MYIHPHVDKNSRMGRFLMNVILAAGGYPYTVRHLTFDQHSSVLSGARETLPCRKAVTEYANWVIARATTRPSQYPKTWPSSHEKEDTQIEFPAPLNFYVSLV